MHKEQVVEALSKVIDPELNKDLISLNMVQDIQVHDGNVSFRIVLTTPACPLKNQIEKEARESVMRIPGVNKVEITMDAKVPNDGRLRGQLDLPIRNAIAVGSGKGGVGKSTIAVNLAVVLAQRGARVGLLDADIYGPNIPTMMGVTKLPIQEGTKLIPAQAYGVKLMSIGFLVKPNQPLIWRGPMLHSALRQFLTEVNWGELDYLIIDLPPGTGDAPLSIVQSLPLTGGIIVTLPQQVSLDDARRSLEMFRQLEVSILGVIENMSYLEMSDGSRMDIFGSGGGEKLAQEANVPFIGLVPIDSSVRLAGDNGIPVVVSHPESKIAKSFIAITEDVAAKLSVASMKQNTFIPMDLV
jgi:ATP-binding protein involved in chromosome partitioning